MFQMAQTKRLLALTGGHTCPHDINTVHCITQLASSGLQKISASFKGGVGYKSIASKHCTAAIASSGTLESRDVT